MRFPVKVQTALLTVAVASACATRAVPPLVPGSSDGASQASSLFFSPLDLVAATSLLSSEEEATDPAVALAQTSGGVALAEPGAEKPTPSDKSPAVHVVLRSVNTHDEFALDVTRDGKVAESQAAMLDVFLSCRRSGRIHAMNSGVLRVLAVLGEEYPGHTIEIISGFRSFPFGVKHSKHFEGRAIDLRVRGVKLSKVRDFVWKNFHDVGVGYYMHSNFIHVDYRPDDKDTAWSSTDEDAEYEYNPRWAMRIRPPWQRPLEATELEELMREEELAQAADAQETALSMAPEATHEHGGAPAL